MSIQLTLAANCLQLAPLARLCMRLSAYVVEHMVEHSPGSIHDLRADLWDLGAKTFDMRPDMRPICIGEIPPKTAHDMLIRSVVSEKGKKKNAAARMLSSA